jgi:hypothetical protein
MLEDFLPGAKPARYINNEINSTRKDLSKVRTKICSSFPTHLREIAILYSS